MVSKCTGRRVKNYFNRNRNVWFVNVGNIELYLLFKGVRENLTQIHNYLKDGGYKENSLQFIEGYFDAEGCVKIIKEKARKTPKICLDMCSTDYNVLEVIRRLLKENLDIEARYSIQKSFVGKDGHRRKTTYHLRVYKKEFIRNFFENISSIKLKPQKVSYVKNWLNNGK